MVAGSSPGMCISTTEQSESAAASSAPAPRSAAMSFTTRAPAAMAARIVAAWRVSMEIVACGASSRITGTTRAISSSGVTGAAPGRVLSPPRSKRSAPASSMA